MRGTPGPSLGLRAFVIRSDSLDPFVGFAVPVAVEGVDSKILDPRSTWSDASEYDAQAKKLVAMFITNFAKFEDHVDHTVRAAAPSANIAAE
ncbi:MAG: hypothetical protein K0M60_17995 [Hydrogenophaga sp.]|nr:hypothetical protein [Hydrogenophaga sp.]